MPFTRQYQLFYQRGVNGTPQALLDAYDVRWTLRLNRPGTLSLQLPAQGCEFLGGRGAYAFDDFEEDDWIFLYRTVSDTPVGSAAPAAVRRTVGPGPYLIDNVRMRRENDGRKVLHVEAETALSVLSRRINPYDGEDARSDIASAPADDIMRELVRQNFLAVAGSYVADPDATRDASALIAVEANSGFAPNYEVKGENANVLRLVKGAADFSASQGADIFYDLFYRPGNAVPFEFRVLNGVYGTDRTAAGPGGITLRDEVDFSEYDISRSHADFKNRVYAGGRNATGAARIYETADDAGLAAAVAANPLALREQFESSNGDTNPLVLADAQRSLQVENRILQADAEIASYSRYAYDFDYRFGDRLNAVIEGQNLVVFVDVESGHLSDQGEQLDIGVSTEPTLRRSVGGGLAAQVVGAVTTVEDLVERLKTLE